MRTSATATNVVLDAGSMGVLQSTPVGIDPEQSAFQPHDGPYGLIAHLGSSALYVLEPGAGAFVTTIEPGGSQGNICLSLAGDTAFVNSLDGDAVIVIHRSRLAVIDRIATGAGTQGLVLRNPYAPYAG